MITLYDAQGNTPAPNLDSNQLPPDIVFIDLLRGSKEEVGFVERVTGLQLPSPQRLSEVEISSRLSMQKDALVVTSPVVYRGDDASVQNTPVGFVITETLLITIRFIDLKSFSDLVSEKPFRYRNLDRRSGVEIFLQLLEIVVDRMADAMEQVGVDLDQTSWRIFEPDREGHVSKRPNRVERRLTRTLLTIGRNGEVTSHARNSLLGLGRLVAYVGAHSAGILEPDDKTRLETLRQDIVSLNEYETRLTDKVQFLLDSTLGFISIEQNRTFKILTIVSVIGVPPTFVVGLYGMNFKSMPEYDWTYGYAWGLGLIALSIIVPTVWLKWRGWF